MPAPIARTASLLTLSAVVVVPLAASAFGCGGSEPPPVAPTPSATASIAAPPVASSAPAASAAPAATETASAAPPPPPPVPTSTVATTKTDPAWAGCHQSFKAGAKDVAKDVAAMGKACEAATKMKPYGKAPMTGKQADENPPQSFPFEAKGGHCYRAYAQAESTIKDLDLVIKDSAGVVVGQDSTDDPSPVVLEDGAVCFSKDDKASVVVSVGMGKGAYAVQIWSN